MLCFFPQSGAAAFVDFHFLSFLYLLFPSSDFYLVSLSVLVRFLLPDFFQCLSFFFVSFAPASVSFLFHLDSLFFHPRPSFSGTSWCFALLLLFSVRSPFYFFSTIALLGLSCFFLSPSLFTSFFSDLSSSRLSMFPSTSRSFCSVSQILSSLSLS